MVRRVRTRKNEKTLDVERRHSRMPFSGVLDFG
jgi:hypothetical protein